MTDRRAWLWRLAPAALVLLLASALVAAPDATDELANPAAATGITDVLDGVREDSLVLVGFDPDIGTYAEVRPTVRALLADLLDRGARLALVSLTPEGRALGIAELARMSRAGVEPDRLVDLGFVPGAEAALVALARSLDGGAGGVFGPALAEPLDAGTIALGVVVGGNDIGPRSWVEQLRPRVEALPLVAVAPSVLLPELQPYLASGQLEALIATPRDGAAYRAGIEPGGSTPAPASDDGPSTLAVIVGLLSAIAVLGAGVGTRLASALRVARPREAP